MAGAVLQSLTALLQWPSRQGSPSILHLHLTRRSLGVLAVMLQVASTLARAELS